MLKFVYLHGFNSDSSSRSGRELGEILHQDVYCPDYDYSRPFAECLASLKDALKRIQGRAGHELCLMGSSLGGFFALQLRLGGILRVFAWNPVIYPAMQLACFLGRNTRFSDGSQWDFTKEALLSYAEAADARQWDNFYLRHAAANECQHPYSCPQRTIFLGRADDLLDSGLASLYWRNHARIIMLDCGHRIEDYSHVKAYAVDCE